MQTGGHGDGIGERLAGGRGQHAAMHRKAGDLVENGAARDVHVDGVALEHRVQLLDACRDDEHRHHLVGRLEEAG